MHLGWGHSVGSNDQDIFVGSVLTPQPDSLKTIAEFLMSSCEDPDQVRTVDQLNRWAAYCTYLAAWFLALRARERYPVEWIAAAYEQQVAVLLLSPLVFSDFLAALVAKLSLFGPELADKEWLAEFFSHAAFYGSVVGAFIAGKDANLGLVAALAVLWFCFCIILSLVLKKTLSSENTMFAKPKNWN
jgi:hypothetical protein